MYHILSVFKKKLYFESLLNITPSEFCIAPVYWKSAYDKIMTCGLKQVSQLWLSWQIIWPIKGQFLLNGLNIDGFA